MKKFVNTSGGELAIYADSGLATKVGTLYRGSACSCILEHDETVAVMYRTSNGAYKVGFTDFIEGAQEC